MGTVLIKQDEYRQRVGERIAAFRKKAGLTQAQLAAKIPCSSDLISRIERGLQDPTFLVACTITCRLGITPNHICPAELLMYPEMSSISPYACFGGKADLSGAGKAYGKARDRIMDVLHDLHLKHEWFDTHLEDFYAFCLVPRSRREMMDFCNIKSSSYFRERVLYPLLHIGVLLRTMPEKPSCPEQKYFWGSDPE